LAGHDVERPRVLSVSERELGCYSTVICPSCQSSMERFSAEQEKTYPGEAFPCRGVGVGNNCT